MINLFNVFTTLNLKWFHFLTSIQSFIFRKDWIYCNIYHNPSTLSFLIVLFILTVPLCLLYVMNHQVYNRFLFYLVWEILLSWFCAQQFFLLIAITTAKKMYFLFRISKLFRTTNYYYSKKCHFTLNGDVTDLIT